MPDLSRIARAVSAADVARTDAILARLRMGQALQQLRSSNSPMRYFAGELMDRAGPASIDAVDQFVGDNKLRLVRPLSSGGESMVFDVMRGDEPHVLKIGLLSDAQRGASEYFLPDIPGVAPYWATARDERMRYGVQPKALRVRQGVSPAEEFDFWEDGALGLRRSLAARGYEWRDPHSGNIGIMPDRTWAALDGAVLGAGRFDRSLGFATPEEAIRALWYGGPLPRQ